MEIEFSIGIPILERYFLLEVFQFRFVTVPTATRCVVPLTCVTTTRPSKQQQQPESFPSEEKTETKVYTGKQYNKFTSTYIILQKKP